MKNRLLSKGLSLLLAVLMVFSILPAAAFAGSSATVDIIVAQYANDNWEILYPASGGTTELTVSSAVYGEPTVYDAMLHIDPDATTDPSTGIGKFLGLEADVYDDDMPLWYCEVDGSSANHTKALSDGNKILLYYMGMDDFYDDVEADWDELAALVGNSEEPPEEPDITVDVIAARNGYDGWEILYPGDSGSSTQLTFFASDEPSLYDAMLAMDPDATLRTNNRINTFLGRTSNNDNTWFAYIGASLKNTPKTAPLTNEDQIIFYYYDGAAARPDWSALSALIENPNPVRTPAQRLQDLLASELTFDKIKGSNTSANNITANMGTLPTRLDANAMLQANFTVAWTSSDTAYISNSGAIQGRPRYGENPAPVTMTATVTAGTAYNPDKYGPLAEAGLPRTVQIALAVAPLTEEEENANKASVQAALNGIALANLKLVDGEALDPDNVLYDLQLVDPRNYGDKTTSYLPEFWSSDNPDVITINYLRGKVTRPAPGQPDATVKLTVTAAKGGYTESKEFTLTVKAVTQAELDAANAELDTVQSALTFDAIKNANISADAVTSSLQMVYRGLGYPGEISWATTNTGDKGVKIEWATSDASAAASYGTVTRPSAADKNVTLTATLTPFRLATYIQPRTVEIPIIVRKVSNSANVAAISLSPSMGFTFGTATKSYDLTAPAIADSVTITVTTEETGTLITSGQHSARGTLTFDVPLTTGSNNVIISTQGLDTPSNTDAYTLNITRAAPTANDTAVLELLESLSEYFEGTSDDWAAMAMSAYGQPDAVTGKSIVENAREAYINGSATDLQRKIIALTALGVNAANVYAGELFADDYLNFVAKIGGNYSVSLVTEAIFGLTALDSGEYSDNALTLGRKQYIDYLLAHKLTPAAGQTAWSIAAGNNSPDVDITAMALAALAPYYLDNTLYPAKYSDITTAVDGALAYLSARQNSSGHYGNSNSTSMVIVGVTALGIDPNANTGNFAKNGKSLIDGLLAFKTSSDRLGYDNNTTANALSTEQGFRALVAYRGFQYANWNAYSIYHFGAQTGDGTALTGENNPDNQPPDPSAPKSVTVRVENLKTGATLMPETTVSVAGTHLDALKAALGANGHNPDTALSGSGFITSILGVSAGTQTGWMYALNGRLPSTMLTETRVAQGDSIIMFYVDYGASYNEPFYLAKFDKTAASIKTGESVTLTLTGSLVDIWSMEVNSYNPINGATVYAYDASGNQIGSSVTTGVDGKTTLTFPATGTYTISAKRVGANNATDLVPPLCAVTVTSSPSDPDPVDPGDTITVYFTLRGLNSSGKEETWINRKAVTDLEDGATVADVIIKALDGTGYTQRGAQDGYLRSITTPSGFTLAEKQDGMPDSGWLYKVNSQLPDEGVDAYTVKNGDYVLLYFTKDYTKDPDAKNMSGGSSGTLEEGEKSVVTSEVKVTAIVKEGIAVAAVGSSTIKDALDELKKSKDADAVKEVKVDVTGTADTSAVQVELKASDIKAITNVENARLTIESDIATLTFDAKTLAGIAKGSADNSTVKFVAESVDPSKLDSEDQKIVGDSPVFDLRVIIGDTTIHQFDGTATVFLPFTPATGTDPETLTVYYLDDSGKPVPMENVRYDAERKGFVFTTTHFSLFFISAASVEWTNPFADVRESDWFYDAVKYANINHLMTGTAADKFSPNAPMTRAMLVTVLYRYEGKPVVTAANPFTDVADGQWYTDAVIWAYENGIVTGYNGGLFGTNDNITREQMVIILRNYAQKKGFNVSKTIDLSAYTDTGEISSWALDAMQWAIAGDLLPGGSTPTLAPKETATRAEVATIFMRYIENIVQ